MSDARLTTSIDRLTALLRSTIEELVISDEDWMSALVFLTEVGKADEFVLLSDVLGLSVFVNERSHPSSDTSTASNVQGPFYLPDAPMLEPPYRLAADDELGEPLFFSGRVTDAGTGESLAGALLDVWQADDAALYDVQTPGSGPHLRGRFLADAAGDFELRTIVPPPYEIPKDGPVGRLLKELGRHAWRPAHLHLKVSHPKYRPLTTMVYFADDPWLGSDTIGSVKDTLVVGLERHEADDVYDRPYARSTFDVALPTLP
jgi:protocatechuate 3,4-dioxygenase beta subunit